MGLFAFAEEQAPATPPVTTMIKADLKCSSVAAASVLAKVERDAMMVGYAPDHPVYGWEATRGTPRPSTWPPWRRTGASELHRRSWRLPAVERDPGPDRHDGEVRRWQDVAVARTNRR